MSTKQLFQISRDTVIPIPIWLIVPAIAGVFFLAIRINQWEAKLNGVWSYQMERETWNEFSRLNPDLRVPSATEIRNAHIER